MRDAAPLRDLPDAVDLLLRSHLDRLRSTPILAVGARQATLQGLLEEVGGPLREQLEAVADAAARPVVGKRVAELEGTLFMALNQLAVAADWNLAEAPEETMEAHARALFALRRVDEAAAALRAVLHAAAGDGGAGPAWPRLLLEARHLASLHPPAALACLREAWERGVRAKLAPASVAPVERVLAAAESAGVRLPAPLTEVVALDRRLQSSGQGAGVLEAWSLLDEVERALNALDMTPVAEETRAELAQRLG